jgi:hypothetical protein
MYLTLHSASFSKCSLAPTCQLRVASAQHHWQNLHASNARSPQVVQINALLVPLADARLICHLLVPSGSLKCSMHTPASPRL